MGLTVKLTRRRSETFPPPYLFLFFIDFSGIFFLVFIFIFEYISGRFLLTSGTRWHYPRAGWKSDPTALVWRDSDFKNNPSDSHSSPSSSVSPISARTRLVLFFYYFFFPFFCLSYILCFCCKWISVFFLFFSVWKMNGFVESADDKQAASVTWTPSLLFSNRRGRWPLNVETRCWGRRCGLHFQEEFFWAYEVKKKKERPFSTKKRKEKEKKGHSRLDIVRWVCHLKLNIAVVSFPTLLNWGTYNIWTPNIICSHPKGPIVHCSTS